MSAGRKAQILIVDDQRETARKIRESLENLNRRYVIADVPSGEEAMLEFQRVAIDLMITEYRLPGISGPKLIERALKQAPNVAILLTTGQRIDEAASALGELKVAGILQKPIDEMVLVEAVTNLLDGKEFSTAEPTRRSNTANNSDVNSSAVVRELRGLRESLASNAIALIGLDGIVVGQDGDFDEALRFGELARILTHTSRLSAEIGSYLGNSTTGAMNYYPGHWYDLYTLAVANGSFLVVVFPGESQKQMGAVLRFGRSTVGVLSRMLGSGARPGNNEEFVILKKTGPLKKATGRLTTEAAASDDYHDNEGDAPIAFADLLDEDAETSTLNLDFDDLDAELEGLEDAGQFWEETESDVTTAGTDSISIDEAIDLGLLPKDMEE